MTHPQKPVLVLVTGPPGAGKTSIARTLADALGLPLLEKDALKETIGGALEITGRQASQRLGAAVFELLATIAHDLVRHGVSVAAEGNFRRDAAIVRDLPPCRVVQVHVSAPPAVLRERLLTRATHDHPVHYDRDAAEEIADRAARGDWDALPVPGALLTIETGTRFPDMLAIVSEVESLLQ